MLIKNKNLQMKQCNLPTVVLKLSHCSGVTRFGSIERLSRLVTFRFWATFLFLLVQASCRGACFKQESNNGTLHSAESLMLLLLQLEVDVEGSSSYSPCSDAFTPVHVLERTGRLIKVGVVTCAHRITIMLKLCLLPCLTIIPKIISA